MKFGVKLTTVDKVGIAFGAVFVWSIGLLPAALGGGILYHFRDKIRAYLIKAKVNQKINDIKSYFTK